MSLRPAQIHRFWRGLPPNLDSVDAVYERPGDHKIVFFKGEYHHGRVYFLIFFILTMHKVIISPHFISESPLPRSEVLGL